MKYFKNFPYSAESLKNEYREFCKKLHPDTGGNAEEFKTMSAEYEQIARNLNGTRQSNKAAEDLAEALRRAAERKRQEEEERKEAEARRRREEEERREEERREAERIAKLQEESRAAVRAWAHILERIPETVSGKKRAYSFDDKKAGAAYVAATKRNIKRVINHYFPGLEVKITISGEIWKEKFIISWEDGPTEDELQKIPELDFFVSSYYESDPYADYGTYKERKGSAPWREAYGGSLGDCTRFETSRGLSEEGLQQAAEIAAKYFKNFDPANIWKNNERFKMSFSEWCDFMEFCGVEERRCASFENMIQDYSDAEEGNAYYSSFRRWLTDHVKVSVIKKEKAPEFRPTYGPTLKAIKKALGGNVFATMQETKRRENDWTPCDFSVLLGDLQGVKLCKPYSYDMETYYSPVYFTSYKTESTRREKFAAVGLTMDGASVKAVREDIAAKIREELADIERQRKEWEQAQQEGAKTNKTHSSKQRTQTTTSDNGSTAAAVDMTEAPADGLRLVATSEGVAVVADDWRTTYRNRHTIKAHGAHWNKEAKQWEATDPHDVETLRAWFFFHNKPTDTGATIEDVNAESPQAEETPTADTLHQAGEISEETQNKFAPVFGALADFLAIIAEICTEAKKYEGITISPDILKKWRYEAEEGTKNINEAFAEVCACLGSLTPESRRDFDALGVIFWTLAEQLRNGCNAETISTATDYARGQLFDLIERTQTPQQAAAVCEALNRHRPAA